VTKKIPPAITPPIREKKRDGAGQVLRISVGKRQAKNPNTSDKKKTKTPHKGGRNKPQKGGNEKRQKVGVKKKRFWNLPHRQKEKKSREHRQNAKQMPGDSLGRGSGRERIKEYGKQKKKEGKVEKRRREQKNLLNSAARKARVEGKHKRTLKNCTGGGRSEGQKKLARSRWWPRPRENQGGRKGQTVRHPQTPGRARENGKNGYWVFQGSLWPGTERKRERGKRDLRLEEKVF